MRSVVKILRFPLGGLAKNGTYRDTTYPTDGSVYSTPMAMNVIGECALAGRLRGGSRPGLRSAGNVVVTSSGRWLWANGEAVLWPDGKTMTFATDADATMPDGSVILAQHPTVAVYRDRLVKAEGCMWMASRTGDFSDFDFGRDSEQPTRSCAGTIVRAGRIGEVITAICSFGDTRLFVASRRNLAVCTGEPTGSWTVLSENVGIVSSNAWCNVDGVLYFIGPNGLYLVSDGSPMLVSHQLPEDLRGLTTALLVYDPHFRGIHIFTNSGDYFYDVDNKAFWPVSYPSAMRPVAGGSAVVDGTNRVVFSCTDGVFRYWHDDQTTDDGTPISSKVAIGPFKCGFNEGDGMIDSLDVTLGENGASVGILVKSAKTAEAVAHDAETVSTPTLYFNGGYNPIQRFRRRGAWGCVILSSTGRWAYESIKATIKNLGRLRP